MKRIYKSTRDRKIAGVCGGIAEYLDIDPTIIRIVVAVLILAYGASAWAYIIACIAMSDAPDSYYEEMDREEAEAEAEEKKQEEESSEPEMIEDRKE